MSDEKNKNNLGDFLRKGVRGLRDRMTFDITDLIAAVNNNDEELVERILYAGLAPNGRDGINRRALPIAVDNNNSEIVKRLLKAKADPNLPDQDGDLPLRKAVFWENETIALMLLLAGANKDLPNAKGISAMLEATRSSSQKMIDLLQDFKNPQRINQIARDQEIHKAQKDKMKAMQEARQKEKQKAARMKEKHKAKIFQSIQDKYKVAEVGYLNALLMAIDKKDGEATRAFIDKIENLNQTEDSGISPLLAAVAKKHTKLASYLVDKGADPFLFIEKHNHSPFSKAVAEELSPFIEYLFPRFKEKIAAYCNDEQLSLSPQFLAYKNPKIFDLLLGAGAKPHWGGREGKAPLVKAVEKASLAMLPVLVKNKIDLNQTVEGKTLLEWAILFNRPEWVSGLLDEMVDLTIPTSEGGTFIDLAQKLEGREDILQLLMEEE